MVEILRQITTIKYYIIPVLLLILITVLSAPEVKGQNSSGQAGFTWSRLELPALPGQETQPGLAGAFSGLVGNDVLIIAGGANFPNRPPWEGGAKVWHDDIYVLKKEGADYRWISSGEFTLNVPAAYGISISIPQGLLCIGGDNGGEILSDIFLLKWDAINQKVINEPVATLPESFEATAGVIINDRVFISGISSDANRLISAELKKLVQDSTTAVDWDFLPGCPGPPRKLMAYAAQNNGDDMFFYQFSGRSKTEGQFILLSDAYAFSTTEEEWNKIANVSTEGNRDLIVMGAPAIAYGATNIMIFGGDDGDLFMKRFILEQKIASEDDVNFRDSLKLELKRSFQSHPGFSRDILVYNTITNTYQQVGKLPDQPPVVTNAILWENQVVLPSGEIYPGVRSSSLLKGKIVSQKGSFGALNYAVLALYFIVLIVIGVYFSFRQKTTQDYFKGGGRIPWWAAGLSVFGTALSAITFMAIPAKTFATDWSYFLYNMSVLLATPVVVAFFIPFFRRLNVTTAYEYLEKRFNLVVRLFGSFSFMLFQLGRIAIILYLPAIALSLVTGIDIYFCIITMGVISMVYTLMGGIEAVIWTDVIQVIVLMGGALLSLFVIFHNIEGSFVAILEKASEHQKFNIANFNFSISEPTIWVVVIGGFFANLVTYSSDQTLVQRYLTTSSEKGAAKTAWTNAILVIPSSLLFFGVGTALYLYYLEFPQKLDPFAKDNDAIFPWYIINELPNGISGLLIAGVFSAAMSSLSSSMNSSATAFTSDFYQRFKVETHRKELLNVAKITTLICGVLGTLLALWMATSNIISLWDMFYKVLGLFTGGLGGLFLLGIISKRANGAGAIIGLAVSSIMQYLIANHTALHLFLYAGIGMLTCAIVGHLASLIIDDRSNEKGKELTIYNKFFRKNEDKPEVERKSYSNLPAYENEWK